MLNGAVSQFDRVRSAPDPARIKVDGRSLAQLVAFAARFGALVTFYDLSNTANGDWSSFFAADPSIALAVRGALDLPEIEANLRMLLAQAQRADQAEERHRHHQQAKRVVVRLFSILDGVLGEHDDVDHHLTAIARAPRRDGLGAQLRDWHHHRYNNGSDDQGWHHRQIELLEDLIAGLIVELRHSAEAALAELDASLRSGGHAPQAAVWNAFAILFDEARYEMNRFPARLIDFYYHRVLRQDQKAARPDELFLTFNLAQNASGAAVARNTEFVGGIDADGQPIIYAATTSLDVRPATASRFRVHRTIYASANSTASPVDVLTGTVDLSADGTFEPFPLFGKKQEDGLGGLKLLPASIGFVIESQTLLLYGGERIVRIALNPHAPLLPQVRLLPPPRAFAAQAAVEDARSTHVMLSAHPPPVELAPMGAAAPNDFMAPASSEKVTAFSLYYSTPGGWIHVEDPTMHLSNPQPDQDRSVAIGFTLPSGAPPLGPVSAKPLPSVTKLAFNASAYPTLVDQPTVIVALFQENKAIKIAQGDTEIDTDIYRLLATVAIDSIDIGVNIDGFVPPILSSPNGRVDTSQSFAPFGLVPAHCSTFEFGAPELFAKTITSLSANIAWAALPVTSNGFLGYYRGYTLDADGNTLTQPLFNNASFRVQFGVVEAGPWSLDTTTPFYLFQTAGSTTGSNGPPPDPAAPVSQRSHFAAPGIAPQSPPPYYDPAKGALQLKLVAPAYAFGHALYTSNLIAASSANAAATQVRTSNAASLKAQVALTRTANATAPDKDYETQVGSAVSTTVSALNSHAYTTLVQALSKDASAGLATASLQAAINNPTAGRRFDRVRNWFSPTSARSITHALQAWMDAQEGNLVRIAGRLWPHVTAVLADAQALAETWERLGGSNPASARPALAATLDQIGPDADLATIAASVAEPRVPNPPWLPTASAFSVSYSADEHISLNPAQPGHSGCFMHLAPFEEIVPARSTPAWPLPDGLAATDGSADPTAPTTRSTGLLPKIAGRAAFYIDLSAPVADISLLFVLTAGPDGWSDGTTPTLTWEKQVEDVWWPITVVSDTTNDLRNSGVVMLQVATAHDGSDVASSLRVVLDENSDNFAYVVSITTNALIARWQGPGGAATRGTPLPQGTIKQSKAPIAGLGSIVQPMASTGGAPLLTGADFDRWMAERLRHKGYAVTAWDYARLVLAAFPSLWQLAVVPAIDAASGGVAPGSVWLIAVPGPSTPNIKDRTTPVVDPGVIALIGSTIAGVSSPFAALTVTNPPYLRLTVRATLEFSGADTSTFWIDKLQNDLIAWLSPWPDPRFADRPADYYTRQAVAEFIRHRPYVNRISHLVIIPERDPATTGWHYFTSALKHQLYPYHPDAPGTADAQQSATTGG